MTTVARLSAADRADVAADLDGLYRWRDRHAWMLRVGMFGQQWAANERHIARHESLLGKETRP